MWKQIERVRTQFHLKAHLDQVSALSPCESSTEPNSPALGRVLSQCSTMISVMLYTYELTTALLLRMVFCFLERTKLQHLDKLLM